MPLPPSAGTLLKRGKEEGGGENVSLSPSPALFFSLMIDSVFKAGEKASGRGGGKGGLGLLPILPALIPKCIV